MGSMRIRRSKKIGPMTLNVTKTGVGLSTGVPGARIGAHSSGRVTKTVGIPGTGIYWRDDEVTPRGANDVATGSPIHASVELGAWFERAELSGPLEDVAVAECGFVDAIMGRDPDGSSTDRDRLDQAAAVCAAAIEKLFRGAGAAGSRPTKIAFEVDELLRSLDAELQAVYKMATTREPDKFQGIEPEHLVIAWSLLVRLNRPHPHMPGEHVDDLHDRWPAVVQEFADRWEEAEESFDEAVDAGDGAAVYRTGTVLLAAIERFQAKARSGGDPAGEMAIEIDDFMAALEAERQALRALIDERRVPDGTGWGRMRLPTLEAHTALLQRIVDIRAMR
jgi:hypothetical protein